MTNPHAKEDISTTAALFAEAVPKSQENAREPTLDPKVSLSSTTRRNQLDQILDRRFSGLIFHPHDDTINATEKAFKDEEPIYIDFEAGDQRNPVNFSRRRKWATTAVACFGTYIAASTVAAYVMGFPSMIRDLRCTEYQATIGLSVYALGYAATPLVTSAFSEEFGRRPLYIGFGIGFLLMFPVIALAKNIETVIVARFLQGSFGTTVVSMAGGTISDIWLTKERGLPMSSYALVGIGGMALGPVYTGWIEANPKLEWKWIQWINMMISAIYVVMAPFALEETRSSIVLTRIAKEMRKTTGDHRYRARVEDERANLGHLIFISCTRPVYLMCTELIVFSFSIWIGFIWGVTFCMIASIPGVFRNLHHFNITQIGTVYMAMVFGSILGFLTNFYQETLYQRHFKRRGPEARLYLACFAAVILPIGMFIYAWSSFEFVHWISLIIGIVLFLWAAFTIYLAVFTYVADCYGPYASSALACQSLTRNLSATIFPLFTSQIYKTLDYKWANTLFGCIATILVPLPFVLFFYGPAIRKRSNFSRAAMGL